MTTLQTTARERNISHRTLHVVQVVTASLVLLLACASPASARPEPIEPPVAPPQQAPLPVVDPGAGPSDLRWLMLVVAAAAIVAACALVVVLWHRAHTAGRRLASL